MNFTVSRQTGEPISREMFGLFFEDINYAADGGLYAEMIENRSFEAQEAHGTPNFFYTVDDHGYAWSAYSTDGSQPRLQIITGDPLSTVNPHYLRFTAAEAGQGFQNQAYDGIRLVKDMDYHISFYARCVTFSGEKAWISVMKEGKCYGKAEVTLTPYAPYMPFVDMDMPLPDDLGEFGEQIRRLAAMDDGKHCRHNDWIRYEAVLTAEEDVRGAAFVITLDGPGAVDFDLISMIPDDAVAGIFRKDLFDALKSMTPGFIRFPGGCIVEGISLANRYQWKNTVGPLKDRKVIPSLWAFDDDRNKAADPDVIRPDASHYSQTYGIGFYEYFLLCELLGAKPLPVLNIGLACQFRSTEMVPTDSPEFASYVQDALDLVEFANGPVDSKWGSLRAQMGHPAPFGLEMISIGNEQWQTRYVDLYRRHEIFEEAVHAVYPDIKLLGTAGPIVTLPAAGQAWDFYRRGEAAKKGFCYAVDEHYYVPVQWMYDNIDFYNDYPRSVKVFAGEYAADTEDRENDMEAALSEAAFLTGVEKNAGVVVLASYAPLFNRIGHSQWKPDMIWFDDANVYLTPSYQVQKLFANNVGAVTVPMKGQEVPLREKKIYLSLVKDSDDSLILKAVNSGESDYELALTDQSGAPLQAPKAVLKTLRSSGPKPANMPEPTVIEETTAAIDGSLKLPAKTFTVVRF